MHWRMMVKIFSLKTRGCIWKLWEEHCVLNPIAGREHKQVQSDITYTKKKEVDWLKKETKYIQYLWGLSEEERTN